MKNGKTQTTVVLNDLHGQFYDKTAFRLALGFIKRTQPDNIVLNGDICDFYHISSFDIDPNRMETLQSELNFVKEKILTPISRTAVCAELHYVEGNHEDRLRKWIWKHGKKIASLDVLDIRKLLDFDKYQITYYPIKAKKKCKIGDLYFIHGDIVRKHAGYSAKAMFEKHGCSVIHGHTHRDGKYTVRTRSGQYAVWENYCLCDLNPEYTDFPNWSQGFAFVTHVGRRPFVEQIPIIGGSYIYGGKLYK